MEKNNVESMPCFPFMWLGLVWIGIFFGVPSYLTYHYYGFKPPIPFCLFAFCCWLIVPFYPSVYSWIDREHPKITMLAVGVSFLAGLIGCVFLLYYFLTSNATRNAPFHLLFMS